MARAMLAAPSGNIAITANRPMPITKIAIRTSIKVMPVRRFMVNSYWARWPVVVKLYGFAGSVSTGWAAIKPVRG